MNDFSILLDRSAMAQEIYELNKSKKKNNAIMFILRPTQLNILGQVFRPIFTGSIIKLILKCLIHLNLFFLLL